MRAADVDAARAARSLPIEYERELVEEAVLLAIAGRRDEPAFRAQRDAIYAVADPDERETRFAEVHAAWFASLDLARPIRLALDELPILAARARVALVGRAASGRVEGADLLVPRPEGGGAPSADSTVAIRLRPDRFANPDSILATLRRELLFVADMLDPAFGYSPILPEALTDKAPRRLLEERYRSLWEVSVAGRLAARGHSPADEGDAKHRALLRALPALARSDPEGIAALAAGGATTHARLLGMVGASLSACGLESTRAPIERAVGP